MKKQNLINLIKYHVENNDDAFRSEVLEIAKDFDVAGDEDVAEFIMELISSASFYTPQASYKHLKYLEKKDYSTKQLLLPSSIEEDVYGVMRAIDNRTGMSKFLFYGAPGTGKTESVLQIGRILNRDVLYVNFEQLIDSRLGETAKNVTLLFDEINHLNAQSVIVVLDELDSIVLDRINRNDLREMGRVTSTFIREIDAINTNIPIIATTNLINMFDKALLRRFDALVSFDRYSKDDLIAISDAILSENLRCCDSAKKNTRLFHKILNNMECIPCPGDLKQIIRTAVAFCDQTAEYDYLRKLFLSINNGRLIDIQELKQRGYTMREIEILTCIPKSSVSRKLKDV